MPHRCDGCLYRAEWEDDVLCELMWYSVLEVAKGRCDFPGPCEDYMPIDYVLKFADALNEVPKDDDNL